MTMGWIEPVVNTDGPIFGKQYLVSKVAWW